jgi:LPS export ABC transporter permease LptF
VVSIVEWIKSEGIISLKDIDLLFLAIVPISVIVIPMALLFSVLIVLGRLSSDSEITAIYACGIKKRSVNSPIIFFCIACMIIHLVVSTYLGPLSLDRVKQRLLADAPKKIAAFVQERDFETLFKGIAIYIEAIDRSSNEMRGIFIESTQAPASIITADRGSLSMSEDKIIMSLKNGSAFMSQGQKLRYITFDEYKFYIESTIGRKVGIKAYETATQPRLREMIKEKPEPKAIREYHMRLAFPVLNLILGIIGITFGIQEPRTTRHTGFLIGIMTIFVYYIIFVFSSHLVKDEVLNPVLGAWLPNIIFSVVLFVFWLWRRKK